MVERFRTLETGHQRPGNSPHDRNEEEDPQTHGRQPQDIAKGILGKTWDQEKKKAQDHPFVSNEIVEFLSGLQRNKFFDGQSLENPGQAEGEPRADQEADHGVKKAGLRSEEITSDELDGPPGNRSNHNLQHLKKNVSQGRIGPVGTDDAF